MAAWMRVSGRGLAWHGARGHTCTLLQSLGWLGLFFNLRCSIGKVAEARLPAWAELPFLAGPPVSTSPEPKKYISDSWLKRLALQSSSSAHKVAGWTGRRRPFLASASCSVSPQPTVLFTSFLSSSEVALATVGRSFFSTVCPEPLFCRHFLFYTIS